MLNFEVLFNTRFNAFWLASFWAVLLLLLYLTLTPSPPQPIAVRHIDKLYHLIAFCGFSAVFTFAFRQLSFLKITIMASCLGIFIEIAQYYLPNRGFSFADMAADILGVIIGVTFASVCIKKCRPNKPIK